MKTSTDRYEIAQWLNFGKYPVLDLDLATTEGKENYLKGSYLGKQVKWVSHIDKGQKIFWHGQLCYFKDSGLCITNDNAMITASFGYKDIVEDLQNANAPIIEPNSDIVVVIHDSKKGIAIVCMTYIDGISNFRTPAVQLDPLFSGVINSIENYKGKEN